MDYLEEILNYAIEKEFEAAKFYNNLQEIVKHNSSKIFLKELEEMELKHAEILKEYLDNKTEISVIAEQENLKISDSFDNVDINDNLSFQQIIIVAMKREENAMNLYKSLADQIEDSNAKNIFLRLSQEEAKHKYSLEKMYDDEILVEN